MNEVASSILETSTFLIVCDERCAVVNNLARLLKLWDRKHVFTFVDRDSKSTRAQSLTSKLDQSRWSLMLISENGQSWEGPEAIPIILSNLPFGKIAAVLYILPGPMWLTRLAYHSISRHRKRFAPTKRTA